MSARLLPDKQHLPALDAWNVTAPAAAHEHDLGRDRLRGQPRQPRVHRQRPGRQLQPADARRLRDPQHQPAPPVLRRTDPGAPNGAEGDAGSFGGAFGWTQGVDYFCNCGQTDYKALQAKLTRRFAHGYSLLASYTYQKAKNNDGSYFFIDPDLNYGLNPFQRTHTFIVSGMAELPFGEGQEVGLGCQRPRRTP